MSVKRLMLLALTGFVLVGTSNTTPAMDVNQQPTEWSEAAAFFNQVIITSKNPIIVNMARASLSKLRQPSSVDNREAYADPTLSNFPPKASAFPSGVTPQVGRTFTEVKLLPQSDNTYVVPALVNQRHTATFLVDTGASYTVITPQMARQLGISINRDTTTVPVTTANGTVNAPLVTIKQMMLGGMRVDNVEAVVTDLGDSPQISGLLGMSFFHGMDLSFKHDRLVIER